MTKPTGAHSNITPVRCHRAGIPTNQLNRCYLGAVFQVAYCCRLPVLHPSDDRTTIAGLPVGGRQKKKMELSSQGQGGVLSAVTSIDRGSRALQIRPRETLDNLLILPIKHLFAQLATVTVLGRGMDVGRARSINIKRRFIATYRRMWWCHTVR